METNQKLLGIYKDTKIHYIFKQNKRFMVNATEVTNYLNIDLSEYLQRDSTKHYIDHLLRQKPTLTKYKVDGEEFEAIIGEHIALEDVLLIENEIYFLHEFLIYDLCKPFLDFYFWIDSISIKTRFELLNS